MSEETGINEAGHNRDPESPLLRVENLQVHFASGGGWSPAVQGISFSVMAGQAIGIVGESGSGKSVTNLAIMGLLSATSSKMEVDSLAFDGQELGTLSPEEMRQIRGNAISMVFQDPMTALNPYLRISTQMAEVLEAHTPLGKPEIFQACVTLLEAVGIPNAESRIHAYPHEFSGGMRQRVLIAMALLANPRLLIADEPTTALDVTIQAQILRLIRNLQQERRMAMILVTHDLGVVAEVVDHVVVMYGGRIMEEAPTTAIFQSPKHPYTRALMACLPRMDRTVRRLQPIEGHPPEGAERTQGCPFANRCQERTAQCFEAFPTRSEGPGGQFWYCWNSPKGKA